MTWKPGDDPEGHPLWAEQVALEWDMVQRGHDHFTSRLAKAREKGSVGRVSTYRRLTTILVDGMADSLKEWLNAYAKSRSRAPIAYTFLKQLSPAVASFITVRAAMDSHAAYGPTTRRLGLSALAGQIGLEAEHQARMQAWTATREGRKLFAVIQKDLKKQRATSHHKHRVNVNRFNALVADELNWEPWGTTNRMHVGLKLLEVLCKGTGHFSMVPDPQHTITGARKKITAPYIIQASDEVEQYLLEGLDTDAYRHPEYLPSVMPPKPWSGMRKGGYYTKPVRTPPLIRFKAHSEEAQGIAMEEFNALEMPRVYSAINIVQEVPWRINKRILEVAYKCLDHGVSVKNLEKSEPPAFPPRPEGLTRLAEVYKEGKSLRAAENNWIANNPEEWAKWKRATSKVHGQRARLIANTRATRMTLGIANMYADKEFYFPHMLDFRGRMYPIPTYLQPQGNDLARGLLTFAHGRPLGEHGGYWLAINVANTWGNDKVPYQERVDWVMSRVDLLRSIARDPMSNLAWASPPSNGGPSKPWQCLAAIIEFIAALDSGKGDDKVSSLPIHVDGTCNGIQHLSALMRDEVGGQSVNLMPSDYPRDVYKEAAAILQERLEAMEMEGGKTGHMASLWLDGLDREIPRSFTKRQVMVLPYGGTREAYFKYTHEWLREAEEADAEGGKNAPRIPDEDKREAVPFMVDHLWAAVSNLVVQGMVCMEWLKDCAKALAETNQPIVWTTPSGFVVRHFYGTLKETRIKTLFDGESIKLVNYERTKDLATKEQLQGISPNFVHSLDASANMETAINFRLETKGAPFTTVHDSFGTTAGDMWRLHDVLRYSFVRVHSGDILSDFRNKCVAILRDHIVATQPGTTMDTAWENANDLVPPVPERGNLDIKEVLNANYFFA